MLGIALKCFISSTDGCDPLVYRVLDDPRRSVLYNINDGGTNGEGLICDDMLPFGWYRFLSYGM